MPTVTLYSKPNCPLCDHARHYLHTLFAASDPAAWTLDEISILDDQDLYAAYCNVIPVVVIAGGAPIAAPLLLNVPYLGEHSKVGGAPAPTGFAGHPADCCEPPRLLSALRILRPLSPPPRPRTSWPAGGKPRVPPWG